MNRKKQALLLVLTIFLVTITLLMLDGVFLAPRRLNARNIESNHEKISQDLNGFKIVYFSDVHYNLFVDDARLERLIDTINDQKPDLVIFGGDLVHDLDTKQLTQEQTSFLIDSLKSINAHYGKFAISGTHERISDYSFTTTKNILQLSEFELIDNKVMQIHYQNDYFNLIALGHSVDQPVLNQHLAEMDHDKFSLAVAHQPKKVESINTSQVDMMLAGYTHGGQINIPLFNKAFFEDQPHTKKTQTIESMRLDITNGVGTSKIDIRMFADGEIVVLTLKMAK